MGAPPYEEKDEAEFMKAYDEALIIGIQTKAWSTVKKIQAEHSLI